MRLVNPESRGRYRLIVADWENFSGDGMVGQKPGWLGLDKGMDVIWHSEMWNSFRRVPDDGFSDEDARLVQTRLFKDTLPTFNR